MQVLCGRSDNRTVAAEIRNLLLKVPEDFAGNVEQLLNNAYHARRYKKPKAFASKALARNGDKLTSQEAADSLNVPERELLVLRFMLARKDPVSPYDIARVSSLPDGSVTPRMKQLELKGLVVAVGTKMGPSGRSRTIYKITDQGAELAAA
jgi:DNA-binding MarR family transcriptional regulator